MTTPNSAEDIVNHQPGRIYQLCSDISVGRMNALLGALMTPVLAGGAVLWYDALKESSRMGRKLLELERIFPSLRHTLENTNYDNIIPLLIVAVAAGTANMAVQGYRDSTNAKRELTRINLEGLTN